MKLVMHIETDEGEGLTDPSTVPVPEDLLKDPGGQRLAEASMVVVRVFHSQYREAVNK